MLKALLLLLRESLENFDFFFQFVLLFILLCKKDTRLPRQIKASAETYVYELAKQNKNEFIFSFTKQAFPRGKMNKKKMEGEKNGAKREK